MEVIFPARNLVTGTVDSFLHLTPLSFTPPLRTNNFILNSLVKISSSHTAMDIYNHMKLFNITPDIITFSILINAFCRIGDFDHTINMLDEMKEIHVEPDIIIFSALQGLCNGRKTNIGYSILQDFIREGCPVDTISFNTVILVLWKEMRVVEVEGSMEEMLRRKVSLNLNLSPYVNSYGPLIRKKLFVRENITSVRTL